MENARAALYEMLTELDAWHNLPDDNFFDAVTAKGEQFARSMAERLAVVDKYLTNKTQLRGQSDVKAFHGMVADGDRFIAYLSDGGYTRLVFASVYEEAKIAIDFGDPHVATTKARWEALGLPLVVRIPRRNSAKMVALSKLYSIPDKLTQTVRDVAEGRRSFAGGQPITLSALDTPRGSYFVLDGHHRVVEAILRGEKRIAATMSHFVPRMERTGGAYDSFVHQKVRIVDLVA